MDDFPISNEKSKDVTNVKKTCCSYNIVSNLPEKYVQ